MVLKCRFHCTVICQVMFVSVICKVKIHPLLMCIIHHFHIIRDAKIRSSPFPTDLSIKFISTISQYFLCIKYSYRNWIDPKVPLVAVLESPTNLTSKCPWLTVLESPTNLTSNCPWLTVLESPTNFSMIYLHYH